MLQPSSDRRPGLRPRHGLAVAAVAIVAAVVAYGAFSFIIGTVAFVVKLAIVLGLAYLAVRLIARSSRR